MTPPHLQTQIDQQIADTRRLSLLSASLPPVELPAKRKPRANTSTNFTESEKDAKFIP
jgi:hypothetical protein